jgi:hypothetical protein
MKVTLDLDRLLADGTIGREEYDRLAELGAASTGSVAFNILVGFGVIAVGGAAIALVPTPVTAIVIGMLVLALGLLLGRVEGPQWKLLAGICTLVGALTGGLGLTIENRGSLASILAVTGLFAVAAVFARSALLAVLATFALSAAIGARTGYFHASYFLVIEEPLLTIILFSALAIGLYQLSKWLSPEYERIALASARTGVLLVNFGFWVGSLWGDRSAEDAVILSEGVFALAWAVALVATAVWAWARQRRWVLNTAAVFGGIHFYTQWFEHLAATPATVLVAGLLALGFAFALKSLNAAMAARE